MSADNWAICPHCLKKAEADLAELFLKVAESYGQIPLPEFDALRQRADQGIDTAALRTFREDYEFYGAEDGIVIASYKGRCHVCGAHVEFKHEVPIPEPS